MPYARSELKKPKVRPAGAVHWPHLMRELGKGQPYRAKPIWVGVVLTVAGGAEVSFRSREILHGLIHLGMRQNFVFVRLPPLVLHFLLC